MFHVSYAIAYLVVVVVVCLLFFFFFKQKTAYEMRISDWSSDVCSSDLMSYAIVQKSVREEVVQNARIMMASAMAIRGYTSRERSEEHTSELQSLMRISYAVFCLKKKKS